MSIIPQLEQITAENKEGWRDVRQFYVGWLLNPLMVTLGICTSILFIYLGSAALTGANVNDPERIIVNTNNKINNDSWDGLEKTFLIACCLLGGAAPHTFLFLFKKPSYEKINSSDRRLSALIMSPTTNQLSESEAKALSVARKVVKGTEKSEFM